MAPTSHPASSRLVLSHIASPPARHQRRHPCDNESYGAVRRFYGAPVKCWRHSRAERRWRSHTNSQRLLKALTQLLNDGRAAASRAEQLIWFYRRFYKSLNWLNAKGSNSMPWRGISFWGMPLWNGRMQLCQTERFSGNLSFLRAWYKDGAAIGFGVLASRDPCSGLCRGLGWSDELSDWGLAKTGLVCVCQWLWMIMCFQSALQGSLLGWHYSYLSFLWRIETSKLWTHQLGGTTTSAKH